MSKQADTANEILAVLTRIAVALETRGIPVGHNDDAERHALQAARAVLKPSANEVKKATPPVSEPEKEAAALPLTYVANIKPIAQRVLVDKGRPALLALLKEFQIESATKLREDQFEAFYAAAEKALA